MHPRKLPRFTRKVWEELVASRGPERGRVFATFEPATHIVTTIDVHGRPLKYRYDGPVHQWQTDMALWTRQPTTPYAAAMMPFPN